MEHTSGIKRIGILTSGGDAPGMNAAVRAAVRTCCANGVTPVGIYRGYNGLIHNDVVEMDARSVNGITSKGGTILYTARSEEFRTEAGQQAAVKACKYLGLDGIIAIGGDGTFAGAGKLYEAGINTIGIPATIDNDVGSTDYTIGFDTAANTAIECIDKLNDTDQSHERTSIVEVMGHTSGQLAMYVGISVGATAILIPERPFDLEHDVYERIREGHYRGKRHNLIITAEGCNVTLQLRDRLKEDLGIDPRVTILGYVQRGGRPSARDRMIATEMGHFAVEAMLSGKANQVVACRQDKLVLIDIPEALKMTSSVDPYLFRVADDISI